MNTKAKKNTTNKSRNKKSAVLKSENKSVVESPDQARALAELFLSPAVVTSFTNEAFSKGFCGKIDAAELINVMHDKTDKIKAGDLSEVEELLAVQAMTLNTIFNELARRASLNMGEYMPAMETYLRLALKTQSQCRATLETLAEIKQPKSIAFVNQANISQGHQQVNNGGQGQSPAPSRAREIEEGSKQTIIGDNHAQTLDFRAKETAGVNNQSLEAVGAVNRAA